jgi:sensor histidine kinase YesM
MIGVKNDWLITKNREALISGLTPGDYRYEVQAKTEFGEWGPTASFSFTVLPTIYQTIGFKIVVVALSICAILLLFYWRIQVIRVKEEKKTAINKKIAEMELKALRSQMNPHFTFNVLNSIQYFISIKDATSAQQYITKFSRLVRMILDQSREKDITLEQKLKFLKLYLELEEMRFENKFHYSIAVDAKINPAEIKMPGMLVQPIVENAVKHGIENKKGNAFISITFQQRDSTLICTVKDNGIGRSEAERLKSNNTYRSLATKILKERIDSLEALHGMKLRYHIEDIIENGQSGGTAVTIEIPIG